MNIKKQIGDNKLVDLTKYENGLMFSPLQKRLLDLLEKNGPMTRGDLVKSVDLPRTTVYDNLTRLQNHQLITKYSRPTNSRGRPLVFFRFLEE